MAENAELVRIDDVREVLPSEMRSITADGETVVTDANQQLTRELSID